MSNAEARGDDVPGASARKAEPTPQIIARAEELLRKNADAPIGTELPFRIGDDRYVARIEEHDNSIGSATRPPGKHKGVTVYVAK